MRSVLSHFVPIAVAGVVTVGSVQAAVWRQATPSLRRSACMTLDSLNHRAVLFGGTNDAFLGEWFNDVWALRLDTSSAYAWTPVDVSGTAPIGRADHAQVYDPVHQRLIILHGYRASQILTDVWTLNLAAGAETWERLNVSGGPSGRMYPCLIYHPGRNSLIMFAGAWDYVWYNETWELKLDSLLWRQLFPAGTVPDTRYSGAAFLDEHSNRMVVFGGSNGTQAHADLWSLDLTPGSERWTELTPGGNPPSPRCNFASDYDSRGRRLFVFGGFNGGQQLYNDLYVLDLPSLNWTRIYPASELPVARRNSCGCFDPHRGNFIVFGGDVGGSYYLAGTEYIDVGIGGFAKWPAQTPPGSNPAPGIEVLRRPDGSFELRCSPRTGVPFSVSVQDITGRTVRRLRDGTAGSAKEIVAWDGRDSRGRRVAAGTYVCLLRSAGTNASAKACAVK